MWRNTYLVVALVIIWSLALSSCSPVIKSADCEKKVDANELAIKKILFLSDDLKMAKNEKELDIYCKAAKDAVRTLRKSLPCFTAFPKQLFQMLISSINKAFGDMCGKRVNKQDVLHKIRCYSPKAFVGVHTCMGEVSKQLDFIAKNTTDAELFPHLCCSVHMVSQCVFDQVNSSCGEGHLDGATYLKQLLDKIFADVLSFICGKTPSLETCINREKKVFAKLNKVKKEPFRDPNRTFFIRPLLDLAERLIAE